MGCRMLAEYGLSRNPAESVYSAELVGRKTAVPDDLPPARREKYEQSGRNSKVLVKNLN